MNSNVKKSPVMTHLRVARWLLLALTLQVALQASSTGMPWENPLGIVLNSMSGPVAITIASVCCIFVGFQLAFRPDPLEYGKTALLIPIALALVVGSSLAIKTWFPSFAGAIV